MHQHERYSEAKQVTLLGAFINALLGIIKIVSGAFFHSHALVADGIHSFADLFTDAMVLFASKYGSQDADDTHPYGHQRIETATTLLLALLLILAGAGIAWDAVEEMIFTLYDKPDGLAIPIALLSIVANEGLFQYTRHIGNRIRSDLILANAWHHRSDAGASLIVLIGLIGSLFGFTACDALAAIIVGLMIVKMGWDYGWTSVKELVDTSIDPEKLNAIEKTILAVDGVQKIHQLRTRSMGRDIFIDVHIMVSPYISVSEGHFIAQHVHQALLTSLEDIKDVTVHVDPEDDETSNPSLHLPDRRTLEETLLHAWRTDYPGIQSTILHYLDGQLIIEIWCIPSFDAWPALSRRIQNDLNNHPTIKTVRLIHQQAEWPT